MRFITKTFKRSRTSLRTNMPRVCQATAIALVISGQLSYTQQVNPRTATAAKTAAGQAALNVGAPSLPHPTSAGVFTTFDVPGAVNGTFASGINNNGFVAGSYGDNVGSGSHCFVRAPNGTFVTFDVPGAIYGTADCIISDSGVVAGYYNDDFGSPFPGISWLRAHFQWAIHQIRCSRRLLLPRAQCHKRGRNRDGILVG